MNKPLVSIIMPAYNTAKFISESIKSVLNQDYENWELIIVDDCSTDNTKDIIKTFLEDQRVVGIFLDKNGGKPSLTKNHALNIAKGKYIAFLDSDDVWLENKLSLQVQYMGLRDNIALCYTGGYWIDQENNTLREFIPNYDDGFLLGNMLLRYEINNQSVILKKTALDETKKYFDENITIGEDYNLFMHIAAKYEIGNIKQLLIKYRIHDSAITKRKKRISDGVLTTLKELNRLYGIKRKFPFKYMLTYLKAVRFKYMKKIWK